MKKLLLLPSLFFASLLITHAQPGTLDVSFDGDGVVTTHVSGYSQASGDALVIQADGKIVTGGPMSSGGSLRYVIARYNTDGSLDNTFGSNGIVNGSWLTRNNIINCLALQPDGKILASGYYVHTNQQKFLLLVRLNTDGSIDNSMNFIGYYTVQLTNYNLEGNAMAVQPNGKIILAGEAKLGNHITTFMHRTYDYGFTDNGFGNNGIDTVNFGGDDNRWEAIALQDDGKIVVAGNGHSGWDTDLAIARYDTSGMPDPTFGTNGKVLMHYSIAETIRDIALQPDGKILACGYIVPGGYFVLRLNADGSLDNTFDSDGILQGNDVNSVANAVAYQDDGSIVIAGATFANGGGTESDIFLRRYFFDGTVDSNFGTNGVVYTDVNNGEYDAAYDMAQQSDLKLVVTGRGGIQSSPATDIIVTRYLTDLTVGVIDNTVSQTLVYPNPIVDKATLEYELSSTQEVSISLLSIDGRLVQSYTEGITQQTGKHKSELNFPSALSSGNYVLNIQAGENRTSVRVVVR